MSDIVVVTTSYPRQVDDAEGHFVAAEVRQLQLGSQVTVLAPGSERPSLFGERVVSLGGGDAFGFPGVLPKLRQYPLGGLGVAGFVVRALSWLRSATPAERVIAHFLLPCGVPIATRGSAPATELEVVVHGTDGRLFAGLPGGHGLVGRELVRSRATLRFVSTELADLVLGCLPRGQREALALRARVQPSPIETRGTPARAEARLELGITSAAKVAVIVARLVPGKRVDVALEACGRVGQLETFVVGEGPERAELARRFPNARFVGQLPRPRALAYIAAADVLVSASLSEGAPSVVREARALDTAVVCLAAGDLEAWARSDPGLYIAR